MERFKNMIEGCGGGSIGVGRSDVEALKEAASDADRDKIEKVDDGKSSTPIPVDLIRSIVASVEKQEAEPVPEKEEPVQPKTNNKSRKKGAN